MTTIKILTSPSYRSAPVWWTFCELRGRGGRGAVGSVRRSLSDPEAFTLLAHTEPRIRLDSDIQELNADAEYYTMSQDI